MSPPLLCAATLLFWGWQADHLVVATVLALTLETPRIVSVRIDLTPARLARAFDVCMLLGFATVGVLALTRPVPAAVTVTVEWLPLLLAPFVAAQAWSTAGTVDLKSLWSNRQRGPDPPARPYAIDFRWLYMAIVVIAAAAANQRTPVFFACLVALSAWALLAVRRRESARPAGLIAFVLAFALAAGLGYAGHLGLSGLQTFLVRFAIDAIAGDGDDTDPYDRQTAIGRIGTIKLSDGIIARLWTAPGARPPAVLHRATYDRYSGTSWSAGLAKLDPLDAPPAGEDWRITAGGDEPLARVRVATVHRGGKAVLAVPWATRTVRARAIDRLARNPFGVLELESDVSGLLAYEADFAPGGPDGEAGPGERDLGVPESERALLARIAGELGLDAADPGAALALVKLWFESGFAYALYQPDRAVGGTALANFLTETRAGHCEYFATATALLLRAAGIPARYATGYSIQEWSGLEGAWLVRRRHAHAWARAWTGDRWVDIDTTPSTWLEAESAEAPFWQPLADWWNWGLYRFRNWRAGAAGQGLSPWWGLAAVALAAWIGWRLRGRVRRATRPGQTDVTRAAARDATDSPLSRLERHLEPHGLGRAPWELPTRWVERIADRVPEAADAGALRRLIALHYRCRYDAGAVRPQDRARLGREIGEWVARFEGARV